MIILADFRLGFFIRTDDGGGGRRSGEDDEDSERLSLYFLKLKIILIFLHHAFKPVELVDKIN